MVSDSVRLLACPGFLRSLLAHRCRAGPFDTCCSYVFVLAGSVRASPAPRRSCSFVGAGGMGPLHRTLFGGSTWYAYRSAVNEHTGATEELSFCAPDLGVCPGDASEAMPPRFACFALE